MSRPRAGRSGNNKCLVMHNEHMEERRIVEYNISIGGHRYT